ncbi:MAG: PQQ-binding-like beta-propeller repeat protein, partial [Polyangiaceae bacterium]
MRRVPILVVAVLVTMVLTAVALKIRSGAARRARTVELAPLHRPGIVSAKVPGNGFGQGPPPPTSNVPAGARTLHGDGRRTDRAAGRVPRDTPVVAWAYDIGGPIEGQVSTSMDEQTLYVASLNGTLTALSSRDGGVKWTLELGDRAYPTPSVADDGTIYVGRDAKRFLAVSPDGKVKWFIDVDGDAYTTPAIVDSGDVVFAAGATVYEVTPRGDVRWRFQAKRKVFTAPAVGQQGSIFFGSQDHHAYALTPDGRLSWRVDLGADVDGAPAIADDGGVFVGTDGDEVLRLDADDGHIAWRTNVGGYVRGPLSVARNGDVLAGVCGPRPRAIRLDGSSGIVRGSIAVQG